MFGNHIIADSIARKFYDVDLKLRQRFIRNNRGIYKEDTYTVLFTEYLNQELMGVAPISVYAEQMDRTRENKYGCDGIIIFQSNNEAKVGMFEAKWPMRVNWDYQQGQHPSHFTDQLNRQCQFKDDFAIWEMFYSSKNHTQSWTTSNQGSTCTWHDETHDFQRGNINNRNWTRTDLAKMIGVHGKDIYQIIYSIIICAKGRRHKVDSNAVKIEIDNSSHEIPLINNEIEEEQNEEIIRTFLRKNNLGFYSHLQLDNK